MTREEIDAIYDAQQNSDQVNNAGITRAEIDAVFDSYEQHKNTVKSQNIKKASVSSPIANETLNTYINNAISRNKKESDPKNNMENNVLVTAPEKKKLSIEEQIALSRGNIKASAIDADSADMARKVNELKEKSDKKKKAG